MHARIDPDPQYSTHTLQTGGLEGLGMRLRLLHSVMQAAFKLKLQTYPNNMFRYVYNLRLRVLHLPPACYHFSQRLFCLASVYSVNIILAFLVVVVRFMAYPVKQSCTQDTCVHMKDNSPVRKPYRSCQMRAPTQHLRNQRTPFPSYDPTLLF